MGIAKNNELLKNQNLKEQICLIEGHKWKLWEEQLDMFYDRTWYYTRTCQVCGEKERIEEVPEKYCSVAPQTQMIRVHKKMIKKKV